MKLDNNENQQNDTLFLTFQGKSDKPDKGNQKKDGKNSKKLSLYVAYGKTHRW
jgi:phage tail tube protein FII